MSWDESADYSTDVVVPKWNFGKLIAVPGGSGPPGPKGDTGAPGPVGPPGPAGDFGNVTAYPAKVTPVDADEFPVADSAAAFVSKKITWANLKSAVGAWYDTAVRTMTNKTLANPKMNGIFDTTNGGRVASIEGKPSSANYFRFINAEATGYPIIRAAGSDTDVGIQIAAQGAGTVSMRDGSWAPIADFGYQTAATLEGDLRETVYPVNFLSVRSTPEGGGVPAIYARGTDPNVSINVVPKNAGELLVKGSPVATRAAAVALSIFA